MSVLFAGEGAHCVDLKVHGNPPPTARCKEGLVCKNSTCQSDSTSDGTQ